MKENKEFLPTLPDLERIFKPIFSNHGDGSRRTKTYLDTHIAANQAKSSNQQLIFHLNQEIKIENIGNWTSCAKYATDVTKKLFQLKKAIELDGGSKAEKEACVVAAMIMRDATKFMQLLETGCARRVLDLHRLIELLLASQKSDARIHHQHN